MARNRQTAWRVEGYRQEIRDHGGLLPEARGREGTAFPDRRAFRHGGFVAVRGQAHAPQTAPYRQARVRQARRGGGLQGLVLVGAALREEVAGGASSRRRRIPRARLARRGHAGRFRRGRRHDRRQRRQDPLPGRHVPAFEHAVRGRDAGRERGMRVRGPGPDLRPHRHGSPRAGARQRHGRGPPRRVEQGRRGARVRHVLRPLPTRDEVLQPVFRQREGIGRERGRLPAAQPHGSQAQRGEPQAADAAPVVEMRRDRGDGPLPFRQADTRAVRRGAGRIAAVAARAFRRGRMGRAQGRQGGQHPDRPGSAASRARHGADGRCSRDCARSRWRSAPPTAGA